MWAYIAGAANCKDTRFECLQVVVDGNYFAEERMQNNGILDGAFIQNEAETGSSSNVWSSQLNYTDYSYSGAPGALQAPFSVHFEYLDVEYTSTPYPNTNWHQFFWNNNSGSENRYITHKVSGTNYSTFGVYCGPFSWKWYPDAGTSQTFQSSGDWGTISGRC